MIHIINKLQLSPQGLVACNTKQKVHLQQGSMDGACAVYSMMMCLIVIRSINYNDVVNLNDDTIKGNTSKGRLIHKFLYHNGFVRKGYHIEELNNDLLNAFRKRVETCYYSIDNDNEIVKIIKETLDHDYPMVLGFDRKGNTGHAVTVIGYEDNPKGVMLYLLDPGYPIQNGQYWNNVIQIETNSNKKYNAYNFVEERLVQISDLLVIKRKK